MKCGINISQNDIYRWNVPEPLLTIADDFNRMKAWGLDTVQQSVSWLTLEPTKGIYDYNFLARLDTVLQRANAAGMDIALKVRAGGWVPSGVPWCAFENLWNDPTVQERFYKLWEMLVNRYKNLPHMKVYALLNEPVPAQGIPEPWTDQQKQLVIDLWNKGAISNVLIQRIRAIDPDRTIMITYGMWGTPDAYITAGPRPFSNIVYAFSWYYPVSVSLEGAEWTGTRDGLRYGLGNAMAFRDQYNVSIWAQEIGLNWRDFGGLPINASRVKWVDDSLKVLNEERIGWFYHSYALWDEDGSGDYCTVITMIPPSPRTEVEQLVSAIKANIPTTPPILPYMLNVNIVDENATPIVGVPVTVD